jgi:hypothetical protein
LENSKYSEYSENSEIQNKNKTNDKIQELQRQNVEINTQIEKITNALA